LFTEQEFIKKKNADLKTKCKKYNIMMGSRSNKEKLVVRIVSRSRTINNQWAAIHDLLEVLKKPVLKDPAPLHNFVQLSLQF
jgi:hypothetical protein